MEDDTQKTKMPWWLKLGAGTLLLILITKYTPILELFYLFTLVVVVPSTALLAMGWITTGTFEAMANWLPNLKDDLHERVQEAKGAKEAAADAATAA